MKIWPDVHGAGVGRYHGYFLVFKSLVTKHSKWSKHRRVIGPLANDLYISAPVCSKPINNELNKAFQMMRATWPS